MSRVRSWAAALLVGLAAAVARADVDVEVTLGHGGRWITECITPVSVTLRNDSQEAVAVRLTLARKQVFGSPPVRHERAVFVGAGATRREWFLVPSPDPYSASLYLDLETDPTVPLHHRGETATRGRMGFDVQGPQPLANAALPNSGRVVAVVGDDRSVLPALLPNAVRKKLVDLSGDLALVEAAQVDPEALALAPFSLEGFDALVLIDPGPETLSDPTALSGVLDWVALGGLLVVSPGSNAATLGGSPLAPYLPERSGAPEQRDMAPLLNRLAAAEMKADEKLKVEYDAAGFDGTWLPVVGLDGEHPYADRALGDGRVRLLAFDARAALRACRDPVHFGSVAEILSGRREPIQDIELAELAGQFRFSSGTDVEESIATVMHRDAFQPPPLIVILAALALYVLVVGPVDWIVLRRLGKQRLTTFTFGGAVLLFTAVAYAASFLVFASGAVVNRMVFVDLADAGRDGRQLIRVHDLVGYYSPRGADQALVYPLPVVVEGAALPGGGSSEVGEAALIASGADPVAPEVVLQVAFRSQRVVRTMMSGTTGRTIETEWLPAEDGGRPRLRLVNGLPVALRRVDLLLPEDRGVYTTGAVAPGAEVVLEYSRDFTKGLGAWWTSGGMTVGDDFDEADVSNLLGFLSRTAPQGFDGIAPSKDSPQPLGLDRQVLLGRTGIGRGAALHEGRALLLATATESPVPLPATDEEGRTHVIIRKELDLP